MTRVTEDPLRRETKGQGQARKSLSSRNFHQKDTEEMCHLWEGEALDRTGPVAEALGGRRPSPRAGFATQSSPIPKATNVLSSTVKVALPQSRTRTHGNEATEQKSPRSSCLGAGPGAGASWDKAATDPRNVWPDNPQGRKGRNPTADKPSIHVPSDREM